MGVVIKKKKKKFNFVRDGCTAFQINEDFYKNILGPLSLINAVHPSLTKLNFFFFLITTPI